MHRFAIFIVVTLSVFPASGAGMARIVEIVDSNTITIEERGSRTTVDLAGVLVPRADEGLAVEFLRRTAASGWALVERDPARPGEAWLYRSPDGLSINGEMIRAAYLHPGTPMTYLGEADPGSKASSTESRQPAQKRRARTPATTWRRRPVRR